MHRHHHRRHLCTCVENTCRSIAQSCAVNCTGNAQCLFGFCLLPQYQTATATFTTQSFTGADGTETSVSTPMSSYWSGDDSSSLGVLSASTSSSNTASWSALDYTASVSATAATASSGPTAPTLPASSSSSTAASTIASTDYTIYFFGSATSLGPRGGISVIKSKLNNQSHDDHYLSREVEMT